VEVNIAADLLKIFIIITFVSSASHPFRMDGSRLHMDYKFWLFTIDILSLNSTVPCSNFFLTLDWFVCLRIDTKILDGKKFNGIGFLSHEITLSNLSFNVPMELLKMPLLATPRFPRCIISISGKSFTAGFLLIGDHIVLLRQST
jgi:hypothetical protein